MGTFLVDSPQHGYAAEIPFRMTIEGDSVVYITNGEEAIQAIDVVISSDSLFFRMPVFGTILQAQYLNDTLTGQWINTMKEDYIIPFSAERKEKKMLESDRSLPRQWKVEFSPGEDPGYGILYLQMEPDGTARGTVRTETGDYRFLEGIWDGQHLCLSAFDGSHVFFLRATYDGSVLSGGFWSGKHWYEDWIAEPDSDFQLSDPDSLTFLSGALNFSFPDQNGDTISLQDPMFSNKVVIVQVTGSWCPNCMDETSVLVDMYEAYQPKGLEIVAIDFELKDDFSYFQQRISRLKKDLNVAYPVLFGGIAKKSEAVKKIPMLNHIMSYPTMILSLIHI